MFKVCAGGRNTPRAIVGLTSLVTMGSIKGNSARSNPLPSLQSFALPWARDVIRVG